MNEQKNKEQVELIRQVFEYIQRFKDKTFVIKIDCSLFDHPFFPLLVKDLVLLHRLGIRIVLVPGAKSRIDDVLSRYNISWKTVGGVRISTSEAIPFIKMAAFDVCNRLMTQLAEHNTDAVIGNWVKARGIGVREGIDYQYSGLVEKLKVDIIRETLEKGLIPIFPNIGWSASGQPYNLSSSELASSLSCTLGAEKLFFIASFGGMEIRGYRWSEGSSLSEEGTVSRLSLFEAKRFLELNPERRGDEFYEFISMAYQAGTRGVKRIHIVDGRIEGVILKEIFSSRGCGIMVYSNLHENIRPMRQEDIPEVLRIMQPYVERGILRPRTGAELRDHCQDFVVYEVDGIIHASGALHIFQSRIGEEESASGEVAGIAVDETYSSLGIGKRIISYLLQRARKREIRRLFVLTTQTADWFKQLGFKEASPSILPEALKNYYDSERNSRVLVGNPNSLQPVI